MENFKKFLLDFRSVSSLIAKGIIIAPFIGLITYLGPPWPSLTGSSLLSTVVQIFSLMYAFEFWSDRSKTRLKRLFRLCLIVAAVSLLSYMLLFSLRTYPAPTDSQRQVKGIYYQERVKLVISDKYTESMALEGAGWDPLKVWEPWTVELMRMLVLSVWLILFVAITLSIASFTILQHKTSQAHATT